MSESTSEWVTVAEVCARLRRSDKSVRRMIERGDLKAEKVKTDTGQEWRIDPSSVPSGDGRETDTDGHRNPRDGQVTEGETDSTGQLNQTVTDTDGQATEAVTDTGQSTLSAHLLEENRFLRAQLEAAEQERRQRAEEHARQLAELMAAHRALLQAQPKALPEATTDATHESEAPDQSPLESPPAQAELLQQIETLKANQDSQRQEMEWMAQQMKTPPSPAKRGWFAKWFGSD